MTDAICPVDAQAMPIAVRAYVCRAAAVVQKDDKASHNKGSKRRTASPSEWALVFDTETTTDAAQKLRFGSYQVRKANELIQSGFFYDQETLAEKEKETLKAYAEANQLDLLTAQEFIDNIFYGVGYTYRATIVGFNLPFDISRLAVAHAPARTTSFNKIMRGGFTFKLSEKPYFPNVQIKHLSSRDSFIQFAATKGQRTSRGNRKKGRREPVRRGFFIDVKTLAAALTSQSYSLSSLAQALEVRAQKHETEDHGRTLTSDYIAYAMQDTLTTWECFERLRFLYAEHGLKLTAAHKIHSEASMGKAYLRDMGIKPWREMQPDFPPVMLGHIMSTYYGGRSEVHIRRDVTQILYCDFLSMYPTVCTLMGLWRFVTAQRMTWRDNTHEIRDFLEKVTVPDLQRPETWPFLCAIVQVMPEGEIFPVRAKYDGDSQYTIGANHLTSHTPLWFTLADCIAAKLLTGRAPKILSAISFSPEEMQDGLAPIDIAGNPDYRVDPTKGDFFKRVIDLRSAVKKQIKTASPPERAALENRQLALKILANATSYGIFVEFNTEEERQLQSLLCYGPSGKAIPINKKKFEAPGSFFHPLLATLITGAARLLLATTERLTIDAGLDWAFCDTDSMALAKPEAMTQEEFYVRAREVQEWFTPLNPYTDKAPLLKVEEYNFSLSDTKTLQPLFCYAISSKRYALFNINEGQAALRKVSAHGLGHLIAPYQGNNKAGLEDVQPWQCDLWQEIVNAALENKQPDFSKLENFDMPAMSRYGVTTPKLEKWVSPYNQNKAYRERIRPFNFLLAMQSKPELGLRPVAAYNKNPSKAVEHCFDRITGKKVSKNQLRTNLDAIAQYHLHPESKFLNGDYLDRGKTQRRHIIAGSVQHIGKEANKWEEQFFMGFDPDAQIEYGSCPEEKYEMLEIVLKTIKIYGAKSFSDVAILSERHILEIGKGRMIPSEKVLLKLYLAAKFLEKSTEAEKEFSKQINEMLKNKNISIRKLAKEIGTDFSNLSKILSGRRKSFDQLKQAHTYIKEHF